MSKAIEELKKIVPSEKLLASTICGNCIHGCWSIKKSKDTYKETVNFWAFCDFMAKDIHDWTFEIETQKAGQLKRESGRNTDFSVVSFCEGFEGRE